MKTCGCQLLQFSETALSFAVKVKLSTFGGLTFVKLWRELRTRSAFDRCEASKCGQEGPTVPVTPLENEKKMLIKRGCCNTANQL